MSQQGISLFELNNQIKYHLQEAFPSELWIVAEISELRANRSGHCYLELIEKDKDSDQILAKARATIWAYTFRILKPYFETSTGQAFVPGIKVLIKVSVEFQELYGLSLNIKDIDPSYTLGDLARRRKEILEKLEAEGVLNMNRDLHFPQLPKTIAVISSPTAAGFEDFTNQLENNPYGYQFHYKLFPAIMQGAQAETSVISALDRIYEYEDIFDAAVIIRGGGSQADLSCFDSYWLSSHIAQFPLPVISGIGHERDDTIVDLVAHTRVKTPTAAAEFLIDRFAEYDSYIQELQNDFLSGINDILLEANDQLQRISQKFTPFVQQILERKRSRIQLLEQNLLSCSHQFFDTKGHLLQRLGSSLKYTLSQRIGNERLSLEKMEMKQRSSSRRILNNQKHLLQLFSQTVKYVNPENILKKGYSLTLKDGRIVKDISQIQKDDQIETRLAKGRILSRVEATDISSE